MKIQERSYSAKVFRPRPEIYLEPDGSFLVITTSWGSPEHATRFNEDVAKYVQAARADVEVTSPFDFVEALTNEANYLRVSTLIANEAFYRGDNKTEYQVGLESLLLLREGNQVAYAQVGAPHLLIQKADQTMAPVSLNYDSSLELTGAQELLLPPLPHSLIGAGPSLNIRSGDFRVQEEDRLVLYSGSLWPAALWTAKREASLQQLTQKVVQLNPEVPFWLGLVDLSD